MSYTRAWKVYGMFDGEVRHRQRESFHQSVKYDWSDENGTRIVEVFNSDITGTNAYSIIKITRNTSSECLEEFRGQISDGVFENSRTGPTEEIKEDYTFLNKKEVINQIKREIQPLIDKIMSIRGNSVRYWLEQLPMEGEYDTTVEEFIKKIEYSNEHSDKEMLDIHLEELADYYYWNIELYDEHFSLNNDCYITIEVGPLEKEPLELTL